MKDRQEHGTYMQRFFSRNGQMLKSIGIGTELFHKLIEKNHYYVDKTPFIKTIFEDNDVDVMLITRPRRFGKTMMWM